jgi:peptidoglycan/LPS O-acetylase OafA/YrhL
LLVLMRHTIFGMESHSALLSKFLAAGQLTWSGVDLFFVLSGFLIGGILLDARDSPRYFQTFYIRRACRIFPLYGAVTALFFVRHLPVHVLPGPLGDYSPLTIPWWAYLTLTQNFWMAQIGWFGARAMLVTWSLAIEEQFYLTIPFLIRKLRADRLLIVLVSIVVGAPLLRELVFFSLPHGPFACFVLMPCRADALCLGVLSALLVRSPRGWELLQSRRKALYWITGVFFAGIVFVAYMQYGQLSNIMTTVGYSWVALFYTCCLLVVVSKTKGRVQRWLGNRVLMWLGTLAYCTYLIHVPLSEAGRRVLALQFPDAPSATWLLGGLLGVAATLVIASLSWKYFEKPLLRRGHMYNY